MPSIFFSLVRKRINGAQPHGRLRHSLTRLSKKRAAFLALIRLKVLSHFVKPAK
jgi:hypothetical protein